MPKSVASRLIDSINPRASGAAAIAQALSGGAGMASHAMSGVYHEGEIDRSQATWVGGDIAAGVASSIAAHVALADPHAQYIKRSGDTMSGALGVALAAAGSPFVLNANAQGQTVVGLKADFLNRSIVAGVGLTGGGALTADRTIALGTPSTLAVASANSASGTTHSHAIASSSNPGAAASLLSSTSAGGLTLQSLVLAGTGVVLSSPAGVASMADDTDTTHKFGRAYIGHAGYGDYAAFGHRDYASPGNYALLQGGAGIGHTFLNAPAGQAIFYRINNTDVMRTLDTGLYFSPGKLWQSNSFVSGFAGNGARWDDGITTSGKTSLELDDITVRGRMRIYELLINQIRATNGSLLVASTGRAESVTLSGSTYTIYTGQQTNHGFLTNDLIRAQRFTGNGLYQCNMRVTGVTDLQTFTAVLISGDAPAKGMEFVRLGNTTDINRQGSVYATSDDSGAPHIDIVNGIAAHTDWNTAGKVKTRLGRLTGIFGAANEYGIASGNGYTINDSYIRYSNITQESNNIASKWHVGGVLALQVSPSYGIDIKLGSGEQSSITWRATPGSGSAKAATYAIDIASDVYQMHYVQSDSASKRARLILQAQNISTVTTPTVVELWDGLPGSYDSAIELRAQGVFVGVNKSLKFSEAWTGWPDGVLGRAEISADSASYGTLMVVGLRTQWDAPRSVSVWDEFRISNGVKLTNGDQNTLNIASAHGAINIGAINGGWAHFYTNMPRYYFDKSITVGGNEIGSYSGDLQLQVSGTTRATLGGSGKLTVWNGFNTINQNNWNQFLNSGFYDSYQPVGAPSATWYWMLNIAHSNASAGSNYQMQIARSFYDDKVWHRRFSHDGSNYITGSWRQLANLGDDAWFNVITGASISVNTLPGTWVGVTYGSGWSYNNVGGSFAPQVQARRFGNLIFLRGLFQATATPSTTIGTMPYWPPVRQVRTIQTTQGAKRVDILSNGQVVAVGWTPIINDWVAMDDFAPYFTD